MLVFGGVENTQAKMIYLSIWGLPEDTTKQRVF